MNENTELKIQALLDGELDPSERESIEALLQNDPAARASRDALCAMRELLRGAEPEHRLPESVDFHWSKIRRQIESASPESEAPARPPASSSSLWLRLAVSGLAALLVALVLARPPWQARIKAAYHPHEVESPLQEMNAITFHSESANMTVVWVQKQWD